MTARPFRLFASVIVSAALAPAPEQRAAEETSGGAPRPNFLVLVADDLRHDTLGFSGHSLLRTPHIDRLAQEGVVFRNAFVTTSICCVSRASIFAGQSAQRHRIYDFATEFASGAWAKTYPALLRAAGYRTGFIGKFGVGNVMPEREFDFWRGFPGQGAYFREGDSRHLTARMGDQAIEFLRSGDTRPFCLSVSFKAPHAEDQAPREFAPDPRDEALFADIEVPVPLKAGDARFAEALHWSVRASEGGKRWRRRFSTPALWQKTTKDYLRLVAGIDREVGRVVEELEARGLLSNTVVLFSSDNGFFLGERGLSDKWYPYEESIRVPLVIVDPRRSSGHRGRTIDPIALNIDIAPTLLDLAGIAAPVEMDGRSLRPLLEGRETAWRDGFYYDHRTLPELIVPCEAFRTEQWKVIEWSPSGGHVVELYDLKDDPAEERNLASDPRHQETMSTLSKRLLEARGARPAR